MAAREHKVSRRVLLGAACVPVLGLVEGPPAGSQAVRSWPNLSLTFGAAAPESAAPWRRALAAFRRAETALLAAEGAPDHLFDARNDAFHAALRRLLRTPAPELPALTLKIDLVVDHEVVTLTGGDPCLATVKADARRLSLS